MLKVDVCRISNMFKVDVPVTLTVNVRNFIITLISTINSYSTFGVRNFIIIVISINTYSTFRV